MGGWRSFAMGGCHSWVEDGHSWWGMVVCGWVVVVRGNGVLLLMCGGWPFVGGVIIHGWLFVVVCVWGVIVRGWLFMVVCVWGGHRLCVGCRCL